MLVLDIDGTISNDSWRKHYIMGANFDLYHAQGINDFPIDGALNLFIAYKKTGVIFLTGRPEKWRSQTELWLATNLFVPHDKIIMRDDRDTTSTVVFKMQKLIEIGLSDIGLFVDDDMRNLIAAKSIGINAFDIGEALHEYR